MRASRGRCIVRKVVTEETLGGGKIILTEATRERMTGQQVIVESVGTPEVCKDKKCQRPHFRDGVVTDSDESGDVWVARVREFNTHAPPPSLKAGAWCLVRPRAFVSLSDTEDLYLVKHSDILAIFHVE